MFNMADNPNPFTESETSVSVATEPPWVVIVLNDPVNLMSYVVLVFRRVFGFNEDTARKHMLEVHEQGRSVLWSGERETAETYVHELHKWQLNALLEREDA